MVVPASHSGLDPRLLPPYFYFISFYCYLLYLQARVMQASSDNFDGLVGDRED